MEMHTAVKKYWPNFFFRFPVAMMMIKWNSVEKRSNQVDLAVNSEVKYGTMGVVSGSLCAANGQFVQCSESATIAAVRQSCQTLGSLLGVRSSSASAAGLHLHADFPLDGLYLVHNRHRRSVALFLRLVH